MSGHTPGEWRVAEDDQNGQAIVRAEHTEICTCWHHCVGSIEQQMRANARLIAGAPAMLEALQACLGALTGGMDGDWRNDVEPTDLARAAIKQATGEPS